MNKNKIKDSVNVLGTDYLISYSTQDKDPELKNLSGYCITSQKKIVVEEKKGDPYTEKWVLRHEIIHAFLHESGLEKEVQWADSEETIVDWIALQFPKMLKAFEETKAL
jgi:Zn-dependent peptidase ImmA (M78 family)